MATELDIVTTPAVPGKTTGEATITFYLEPEKKMEIAHQEPTKIVDLLESPDAGKRWFVTVKVFVVETDA